MANIFATLYGEAQNAMRTAGTLYGGVAEATEADVMESYMQYSEAAAAFDRNAYLYAEATSELMERNNLSMVGAFFYAEAEGGFFKRIINALIKLYEKAKEFVIKLFGRFKSNKSYRNDIIYIKQVLEKMTKFTAVPKSDTLSAKEVKFGAITNLVMGTIGEKNSLLGKNLKDNHTVKTLSTMIKNVSKVKGVSADEAQKAEAALNTVRNEFNDVDAICKHFYKDAIGQAERGDAKFDRNSQGTSTENVAKLWNGNDRTYKGGEIVDYAKKLFKDVFTDGGLDFDDVEKALDKGISVYKETIDDLKRFLSEAESNASSVQSDSDNTTDKDAASKLMNISTNYSQFMTNLSTAVVTAYNTGKIQLDKLLAALKAICDKLDKFKKLETSSAGEGDNA